MVHNSTHNRSCHCQVKCSKSFISTQFLPIHSFPKHAHLQILSTNNTEQKRVPEHCVLMYKVFSSQLTSSCIQAQSQTQFIGSERQKSRAFAFAHFNFLGAYSGATLPSSGQNLICATLKPQIHNRLCSLHTTGPSMWSWCLTML